MSELGPRTFMKNTEVTERKSHGNCQPSPISNPFGDGRRNSLRPSCGGELEERNIWMQMINTILNEEKMK